MNSGMARLFGSVAYGATLVACLTIGAAAVSAQTPAATSVPPTAMPQAPQTPPVTPPLRGAAAAGTGKSTSLVAGANAATCEKYIAALSGKKADPALLKSAEVQALASAVPDLPTCGAVAADSEALCQTLPTSTGGDKKDDPRQSCRKTWAQFHELRKETGRPFITEVELEECRASKEMKGSCDAIAEAFRTGDPTKCPRGQYQFMCQAAVGLDPSSCRASGPKAAEEIERCKQDLEQNRLWTKGLKAIAQSGQPSDQQFARAALGEEGACAAPAASAMRACTTGAAAPMPTDSRP